MIQLNYAEYDKPYVYSEKFKSKRELLVKLYECYSMYNNELVYIYILEKLPYDPEFPAAGITRSQKDILKFAEIMSPKKNFEFTVFECTSYEDALATLQTYFETSSLGYEKPKPNKPNVN